MRLLLDSHALYWWMIGSPRLSATAQELILDKEHTVAVRAVSISELESKARRRRVELPPQELRAALRRNAVEDLAISHDHAEYAAHAAQSRLENCTLVSIDEAFDQISIERIW